MYMFKGTPSCNAWALCSSNHFSASSLEGVYFKLLFTSTASSLGAVSPGRFQVMDIDTDVAIKKFVEDNGNTFKVVRGLYQLTKSHTM